MKNKTALTRLARIGKTQHREVINAVLAHVREQDKHIKELNDDLRETFEEMVKRGQQIRELRARLKERGNGHTR